MVALKLCHEDTNVTSIEIVGVLIDLINVSIGIDWWRRNREWNEQLDIVLGDEVG